MVEVRGYVCSYCSAELKTHDSLKPHILSEHQAEEATSPAREPEEIFIKGMGLGGHEVSVFRDGLLFAKS